MAHIWRSVIQLKALIKGGCLCGVEYSEWLLLVFIKNANGGAKTMSLLYRTTGWTHQSKWRQFITPPGPVKQGRITALCVRRLWIQNITHGLSMWKPMAILASIYTKSYRAVGYMIWHVKPHSLVDIDSQFSQWTISS